MSIWIYAYVRFMVLRAIFLRWILELILMDVLTSNNWSVYNNFFAEYSGKVKRIGIHAHLRGEQARTWVNSVAWLALTLTTCVESSFVRSLHRYIRPSPFRLNQMVLATSISTNRRISFGSTGHCLWLTSTQGDSVGQRRILLLLAGNLLAGRWFTRTDIYDCRCSSRLMPPILNTSAVATATLSLPLATISKRDGNPEVPSLQPSERTNRPTSGKAIKH